MLIVFCGFRHIFVLTAVKIRICKPSSWQITAFKTFNSHMCTEKNFCYRGQPFEIRKKTFLFAQTKIGHQKSQEVAYNSESTTGYSAE